MIEIKPGPELDRAVAEAVDPHCSVGMCASSGCIDIPASQVGGTAATDPDVLAVWKWDGERTWRTLPKFSTDLNAAFRAAEKGHLFVGYLLGLCDEGWYFQDYSEREMPDVFEPTPALAICVAILKLAGKETFDIRAAILKPKGVSDD